MKKRVAIVGTGTRALCFAKAIIERVSEYSEMVGLMDTNPERIAGFQRLCGSNVPAFTDFDEMVRSVKPDTLLVCVPDYLHPEYVERGFAAGLNVVTEKPMAMNREGIDRIRKAEKKYNKKVIVTFNMRFTPYAAAIKKLLMEKPIGRIHSVNAEWFLDRTHGLEYFHRWHADISKGGGLLVHKATHHFDLLNWFLDDEPVSVFAKGDLRVFGAANSFRGERCSTCPHARKCWAVLTATFNDPDLNPNGDAEIFKELFFKAEKVDNYFRDRCCFSEDINIYDTMNVMVQYKSGTYLNYLETAYAPWQGYSIVFNGDDGRIEVNRIDTKPASYGDEDTVRIIKGTNRQDINFKDLAFKDLKTPHGGGDYLLYDQLFGAGYPDPLGQVASSRAGAMSALIGITANESIVSGKEELINFKEDL